MDKLVIGFSRIVREVDKIEELAAAIPALGEAALSDPTSLSDTNKRRLLDFPDADSQSLNITDATSLTRSELLKRGAKLPKDLTTSELSLLRLRYWSGSDYTKEEKEGLRAAYEAFASSDDFYKAREQLAKARSPLYEEFEEKALANADPEFTRRMQEAVSGGPGARDKHIEKCERTIERARPWIRRLWEEDGREPFPHGKAWGWAVYIAPSVASDRDMYEEYMARADGALFWARIGICCGDILSSRWELQHLEWPHGVNWNSGPDAEEGYAGHQRLQTSQDSRQRYIACQKLRKHFTSLLQQPAKKRRITIQQNTYESEAHGSIILHEGILRNTFLVIDQACVDSTIGTMKGVVDDMWVWAVDPFYNDQHEGEGPSQDAGGYPGFLRVRLQQLANNFYEVRRFYDEEYPLEKLWQIAQQSVKQTFISVKEGEKQHWLPLRDVGSAIRPSKTST